MIFQIGETWTDQIQRGAEQSRENLIFYREIGRIAPIFMIQADVLVFSPVRKRKCG